jgi:hypothetical protein
MAIQRTQQISEANRRRKEQVYVTKGINMVVTPKIATTYQKEIE